MWIIGRWLKRLRTIHMFFKPIACTNCGNETKGTVRCCMRDRCIESQNKILRNQLTIEQQAKIVQDGGRVVVETGRPLCWTCANANNYVCCWCELEASEETKK